MYKINVVPYFVNGEAYKIKESLVSIIFNSELRLTFQEAMRNDRIAKKIESCDKDILVLEDAEYEIVKKSFDFLRGVRRVDLEFVQRVMNAEYYDANK